MRAENVLAIRGCRKLISHRGLLVHQRNELIVDIRRVSRPDSAGRAIAAAIRRMGPPKYAPTLGTVTVTAE